MSKKIPDLFGSDKPLVNNSLSIAISGSGGSGAITAGLILFEGIARAGLFGLIGRSVGPQIRGGESVAMVRISDAPINCLDDRFDLLISLDWLNFHQFANEIPLDSNSLVVFDSLDDDIPESVIASGARLLPFNLKKLATTIREGRPNMVALGMAGKLAGLPLDSLEKSAGHILIRKGEQSVDAAVACIAKGFDSLPEEEPLWAPSRTKSETGRWNLSGNEACGLGALRAGIRFVAAYPITPASDILEWLAPRLEKLEGVLLQAEDELAAVNMTIGASFGGVPSLTATSGPGLSLMMEGAGLAVASETPIVVVNVTRGGPSTGIPTKSEQSDLNIALFGLHGDSPHLVLAPLSISDCATTTQWAVGLAERLQTLAIILTDQSLGQMRTIMEPQKFISFSLERIINKTASGHFSRYRLTPDGVSPVTIPGRVGGRYVGEGLEHNEQGTPSSMSEDHLEQLNKRQRKLDVFDYGERWAKINGEGGGICLLTWGSSAAVVLEAADRLRAQGHTVRVVAVRLLAPLQKQALMKAIEAAERVLVVELNHQAQFFHYLHAQQVLPQDAESFARPGPIPLRPGEIVNVICKEAIK